MILPIVLTGRLGLPHGGVPNFTLDPNTGEVIGGQFWPQGAGAADPVTGEPVSVDSAFTNDAQLWTAGKGGADPNVLNTAPLWDTRGTQWNRRGSMLSESAFDAWRRAGKPTACSKGISGYAFADGTPCDPGIAGPLCQDSTQRILQAIAAGANAAAYPQQQTFGYPARIPGGGSVTVSGGASPMAWLFGGAIVVGLIYAVTRR